MIPGAESWDFVQRFINVFAILSAICGSTWFISSKFNDTKSLVYAQVNLAKEAILAKLEYHERHDDKRFEDVYNQLWEIKVRNAAVDDTLRAAKKRILEEK